MLVKDIKVYQKMKNKGWSSIEKTLQNEKKSLIIIIKNYFHLETLAFLGLG